MVNLGYTNSAETIKKDGNLGHSHTNNKTKNTKSKFCEVLDDGSIISAGDSENNNNRSGAARWTLNGHKIWHWQNHNSRVLGMAVDTTRDEMYIATRDGELFCLNINTGEQKYQVQHDNRIRHIRHIEGEDYLYLREDYNSEHIAKIAKSDGSRVHTSSKSNLRQYSLSVGSGDYYYAGSRNNGSGDEIYRFNKSDGSLANETTVSNNVRGTAFDDSELYVTTDVGIEKYSPGLGTKYWEKNNTNKNDEIEIYDSEFVYESGRLRQKSDGRLVYRQNTDLEYIDGSLINYGGSWYRQSVETGQYRQRDAQYNSLSAGCTNNNFLPAWEESSLVVKERETRSKVFDVSLPANDLQYEYPGDIDVDDNKNVFAVITPGGRVESYDFNANKRWTYNFTNEDIVITIIADNNGGMYYSSMFGDIGHIDSTGTKTYSVNHFDGPVFNMEMKNGSLHVCGWKEMKSINPADGTANWTYSATDWIYDSTVNEDNGNIYLAIDKHRTVRCIDNNGNFVEDITVEGRRNEYWTGIMALEWSNEENDNYYYTADTRGRLQKCSENFVSGWYIDSGKCVNSMDVLNGRCSYSSASKSSAERISEDWPMIVADKKMKVEILPRKGEHLYMSGSLMNRMLTEESKKYEFILAKGDTLSCFDTFYATGLEIEE